MTSFRSIVKLPVVPRALRTTVALIWQEADSLTKRMLAVSFVLLVIGAALSALTPVAYKLLIDAFTGEAAAKALITPAIIVAAYVAFNYVVRGVNEVRAYVHGIGLQRVDRRLSRRLFAHIISLPLRFHLDRKTGAVGQTLAQGLQGCHILLQHLVFTFLPVTVEFVIIITVLIHFGHSVYLAILGATAVGYLVAFWYGSKQVVVPSEIVSTAHIAAHATLTDSLLNYETVKYFNAEPVIEKKYDSSLNDMEVAWKRLLGIHAINGLVIATIFGVSLALCISYTAHRVLQKEMTVGDFVLINGYLMRLIQPIEAIGYAVREMSQGLAFLRKMLELFDEPSEHDKSGAHDTGLESRGEISFEGVSFSYDPKRFVLKDVSFTASAGKTVAIVGMSGSGKSSLIRLLFRLYEPTSGRILLDGKPIADMPRATLREAIAVVPQDTVLFNDTIGHNIAFGKQGATQADIERAAKLANLHALISGLPEGYDTPVGERGLKLSGGEKQRVAIARAAIKRPRIFVFDEATSSLDSGTEKEILQNLVEVSKSSTTLVIAHRLSTVVHADEILVLDHGAFVERGTHQELLQRNGRYAMFWRAQQGTNRPSQDDGAPPSAREPAVTFSQH